MHKTMERLYRAARQMHRVDSQVALATKLGESSQTVNNWETRGISKQGALKAQELLGISATWVRTGEGEMTMYAVRMPVAAYDAHGIHNVSIGPRSRGRVPVISWVQAGDWGNIVDNFAPGDAENWLPCPSRHSDRTFALRVRGVSMEPRYQDGDIIFLLLVSIIALVR